MLLSGSSKSEEISACPRRTIFNNCEQNNLISEILNYGDNVDDQEDYGL